jgi:hypothetical protein
MSRKSNQQLIKEFRDLLTHGFFIEDTEGEPHVHGDQYQAGLLATKAWRSDLWVLFNQIKDRLDPLSVELRERNEKQD